MVTVLAVILKFLKLALSKSHLDINIKTFGFSNALILTKIVKGI